MSAETRESIRRADHNLGEANQHLELAKRFAEQSGDKSLTTKIGTVQKTVETVREDIKRQMSPKQG